MISRRLRFAEAGSVQQGDGSVQLVLQLVDIGRNHGRHVDDIAAYAFLRRGGAPAKGIDVELVIDRTEDTANGWPFRLPCRGNRPIFCMDVDQAESLEFP